MKLRPALSHWTGLWATLAAIAACAALTFAVPTPLPIKGALYAIPLTAIVYASYSEHAATALASATLGGVYAILQYDALDMIFPQRSDRILLGGTVAFITLGMSFSALGMRRVHDQAAGRALHAEHALAVDLSTKNAELELANAALTSANRALEAFTYVVSHDLKEPTRALAELARSLREDHARVLDDDGKDIVRRSVESSLRLETLLNGLLEFSRAAQIQPFELEVLRVDEVVVHAECRTRYETLLRERQGELVVEPGPAVRASVTGLCQVMGNLVLNAIKHNPEGGARVHVRSRTRDDDPRLVDVLVSDNGPGYPQALIQHFNRAGRGRPTTLRGGFGLIIARQATEKMGGRMQIANSPEGGARAVITLAAAPTREGSRSA